MELRLVVLVLASYLIGSIPTAIWFCRIGFKMDITKVGSGNPGMTNVWRTLGWKPALPVAIIDAAKGVAAAALGAHFGGSINLALTAGVMAVLGHSFSFWVRFKGGKSVLTGFGMFLFLSPIAALTCFATWILVMYKTRIVSISSITSAILIAPLVYLEARFQSHQDRFAVVVLAFLVGLFVVIRHRSNIGRLVSGTEPRFVRSNP